MPLRPDQLSYYAKTLRSRILRQKKGQTKEELISFLTKIMNRDLTQSDCEQIIETGIKLTLIKVMKDGRYLAIRNIEELLSCL